MIESFYRIRAGATRFEMTGLQPRSFLGHPGFQFDYEHLGGDEVERQGRAVGAIIERPLLSGLVRRRQDALFPRRPARVRAHRRKRPVAVGRGQLLSDARMRGLALTA